MTEEYYDYNKLNYIREQIEIMSKFNSGYLRTVDVQKSFYETKTLPGTKIENSQTEPLGLLPFEITQEKVFKEGSASNTGTTPSNTGGVNTANNTNQTNTTPPGASPSVTTGGSPSATFLTGAG